MADERRQYSRIAFHTPARLVFPQHSLDAVVLDLSLKGALVRLPAETAVQEGSNCVIHVSLDSAGDQISMEARITHIEGRYIGLLCRSIDLDSVTHLRRLVELNVGDPELLNRELSTLINEHLAGNRR